MRLVRSYFWDGACPLINLETLYAPIEMGGRKLLDLRTRNEAIQCMKIKEWLNFSPDRAKWAFVCDEIIRICSSESHQVIDRALLHSPVLQKWNITISSIPDEIKALVKGVETYGVRLEGAGFSESLLRSMPVWNHAQATRKLRHGARASVCLRTIHSVVTLGDIQDIADLSTVEGHRRSYAHCECAGCLPLRDRGCPRPNECIKRAKMYLDELAPKWKPDMANELERIEEEWEERRVSLETHLLWTQR